MNPFKIVEVLNKMHPKDVVNMLDVWKIKEIKKDYKGLKANSIKLCLDKGGVIDEVEGVFDETID